MFLWCIIGVAMKDKILLLYDVKLQKLSDLQIEMLWSLKLHWTITECLHKKTVRGQIFWYFIKNHHSFLSNFLKYP